MGTIAAQRDGIKTRLETIASIYAHDVWPPMINQFPAALIRPLSKSARQSMSATSRMNIFEILFLAGPADRDLKRSQDKLDEYLDDSGAKSIIAALEADRTLGGQCTTLDVSWRDYGSQEIAGAEYVGAVFEITIWP